MNFGLIDDDSAPMALGTRLNTAADWREWISSIQRVARDRMWAKLDPTKENPEPDLEMPVEIPLPEESDPTALALWDRANLVYGLKLQKFEAEEKARRMVAQAILSSLPKIHHLYLVGYTHPRDMLIKLKDTFVGHENLQIHAALRDWNTLVNSTPNTKRLNEWLKQCERAFDNGHRLGLCLMTDKDGMLAKADFITATRALNRNFYEHWYPRLLIDDEKMSFHRLVYYFRAETEIYH